MIIENKKSKNVKKNKASISQEKHKFEECSPETLKPSE